MTIPEKFPHAEERRLLYVALTRAKKQVLLVARRNRDSEFAAELILDEQLNVISVDSSGVARQKVQACPKCKKGILVLDASGSVLPRCPRSPRCV